MTPTTCPQCGMPRISEKSECAHPKPEAPVREWWVNDTGQVRYCEAYRKPLMQGHCIHVIEYAAFEQMRKRNALNLARVFELERTLIPMNDEITQLRAELGEAKALHLGYIDKSLFETVCEERDAAMAEVERLRHANANFHDVRRELAAIKEQRDTAESLLRELVSWRAKNEHDLGVPADVAERARKLLGRQAGEL